MKIASAVIAGAMLFTLAACQDEPTAKPDDGVPDVDSAEYVEYTDGFEVGYTISHTGGWFGDVCEEESPPQTRTWVAGCEAGLKAK